LLGTPNLGTITFKGEIEGCVGVTFEEEAAKAVSASMLCLEEGEEVSEEDLADAVGEVANMIMGGVKSRLQDEYGAIEISIPTVISGRILKSNVGDAKCRILKRVNIDTYNGEFSFFARESG
jgi:CheY-specific phosphatase CheX